MNKLFPWRVPPGQPITLLGHIQRIYNDNLDALATRPLEPLTLDGQLDWWSKVNHNETRLWVYTDGIGRIVAFMKLTDRGSYVSPLFAIDKAHWGKGYGTEIIQHYLEQAKPKALRGSQLLSNPAICAMNAKAGWQVLDEKDGVQYLFHPNGTEKAHTLDEINKAYLDYWER